MELKPVNMICEREHIPRPFAYKILKRLEHAGIVKSYRGAAGGYILAKEPDDLTLFSIVSAIDEQLFVNECLRPDFVCSRNSNGEYCGVHKELTRVQGLLVNALSENKVKEII